MTPRVCTHRTHLGQGGFILLMFFFFVKYISVCLTIIMILALCNNIMTYRNSGLGKKNWGEGGNGGGNKVGGGGGNQGGEGKFHALPPA